MDILEIMARGHSTHMAWVWDKMTETRRNVALTEMRAVVDALSEAGYCVVARRNVALTEMQAVVDALNMAGYCVVPIKSAP